VIPVALLSFSAELVNLHVQRPFRMQLAPSASLSHIVKHFLILKRAEDIDLNYRLFSDGNPGLVFHFKHPLIQYEDHQKTETIQPKSFIYGQITHYNDLRSSGELGMLVVVLQPYGIYNLLRINASDMNNCVIRLADLFGREALDLEDRILNADSVAHIILSVEQFLMKKGVYVKDADPVFEESLQFIYDHKGILTIEELLKKIPVTERQLERKYNKYIGTTPKKFSDIIKFQHFLKRLQRHRLDEKMTDAIYDGGYYDQSHLNNYFKKTTGLTPWQYKLDHRLLALNFMQLSQNA
jgi:AraC-like DNA-binding protein